MILKYCRAIRVGGGGRWKFLSQSNKLACVCIFVLDEGAYLIPLLEKTTLITEAVV